MPVLALMRSAFMMAATRIARGWKRPVEVDAPQVTAGTSTVDLQHLAARCPRLGGQTLPVPQFYAGAQE